MSKDYTTISGKKEVIKKFQRYCRERGFSPGRALEMAMNDWMNGGCDKSIENFKNRKED